MIPLYLKLKTPSTEEFYVDKDTVEFNSKLYKFQKIFDHDESLEYLVQQEHRDGAEDSSPCYIFMGPTGSGKTTALRELLNLKLKSSTIVGSAKYPTFLSAFEVANNKYAIDLLERDSRFTKKEYHHSTRDISCKKVKFDNDTKDELLNSIFRKRLTQSTPFNTESSRSCLVIYLIQNGKKFVYMDLMGNEKFDKAMPKMSNVFANMNISSITKMLTTANSNNNASISPFDDPFYVRSSNFITNLIFKKNINEKDRKINICLVIDPQGDNDLNKSAFNNIAELVQNDVETNTKPSQLQSTKLTLSPTSPLSLTVSPPNYTRPTIASLSPIKMRKRSQSISPKKCGSSSTFNSQRRSLSISPIRKRVASNDKPRRIVSAPINSNPGRLQVGKSIQVLPDDHEIQISSLMKELKELKEENVQLKSENKVYVDEKLELTLNMSTIKHDHELEVSSMKDQLTVSQKLAEALTKDVERLDKERSALTTHWNEFKGDFFNFQNEHESFNKIVDALKFQLDGIKGINDDLTQELKTVRVATENLNNSNQEEIEKLENTLETYEETILELNNQNETLQSNLESKECTIAKHQNSERELTSQLLKTKEQLDEYNYELHELKEVLEKKTQEVYDLKQTFNNTVSLTAELGTVRSELEQAKLQLEQTDDLTDKLNSANIDLESVKGKLSIKMMEAEKLELELSSTRDENTIQLEAVKGKLQQTIFEMKDLNSKFDGVNEQLDVYKLENEELTKKLAKTERDASNSTVHSNLSEGVETVSFPKISFGSFSPPTKEIHTLPSIDFLDQFTTFSDSIFHGPQIYEDVHENDIGDENGSTDQGGEEEEEDTGVENAPLVKPVLGPSKQDSATTENRMKRSGQHFHHPPLKSSKLRNIIYS
ncbi:hypothetical protein CLIB1423_06S02234 [[Candida] railenensis]|uniref:Kinesin motor domain-containing protein n=1 Tax=[Candida] railenensis TaxID=45579 RepID=A0A9P0VY85_9ASCO|nr:hypothetical protein CLIB1423_06S02234 [[Candida] railenensis]